MERAIELPAVHAAHLILYPAFWLLVALGAARKRRYAEVIPK